MPLPPKTKKDVIKKEIAWLLDVSFIREVYHPDCLASLVLVPKKNKELRMCVDYTNLNCACKKDPFSLPRIDQVMDSTVGCSLLASWIATWDTIRSLSRSMIKRRCLSLLHLAHFVIQQCPSDLNAQVSHTRGVYKVSPPSTRMQHGSICWQCSS
jgi:hypothetical protein